MCLSDCSGVRPYVTASDPLAPCFNATQMKYLSEAGAVVIVGLVLSGIVALAMGKESQVWLRGISPTTFFIGTSTE